MGILSPLYNIVIDLKPPTSSQYKPELKPDIWSPATAEWAHALNSFEAAANRSEPITNVAELCPPVARTPFTLAAWDEMAAVVGNDNQTLNWELAMQLVDSGWGLLGHPDWGNFTFGHGYPPESNSGLFTIVMTARNFANLTSPAAAYNPSVVAAIHALSASTLHLGPSDLRLLAKMADNGSTYLHAVATYEANVVKYNLDPDHPDKLTALYPLAGTWVLDHPACIMDQYIYDRNTTSITKFQAAAAFVDFLVSDEAQGELTRFGLRPLNNDMSRPGIITAANGANPGLLGTDSTYPVSSVPRDDVLTALSAMYVEERKPTVMAMVLDASGMSEASYVTVQRALIRYTQRMRDEDCIILVDATDGVLVRYTAADTLGMTRAAVRTHVLATVGGVGDSHLYDAIIAATNTLQTAKAAHPTAVAIGMIVATIGADVGSAASEVVMLDHVGAAVGDHPELHSYSVSPTPTEEEPTNTELLDRLADITRGAARTGKTDSEVDAVLKEIAMQM